MTKLCKFLFVLLIFFRFFFERLKGITITNAFKSSFDESGR